MRIDLLEAQLRALAAQLDATLRLLGEGLAAQAPACTHPDECRVTTSTYGEGPPTFYCRACRQEVQETEG